ncbi:MAG: hypothetical protein ACFNQF_08985, partial [Bacteroides sp.]
MFSGVAGNAPYNNIINEMRTLISGEACQRTYEMLFTLKDDCKAVILYSLFSTMLAFASRFTSTTIR